MADRKPQDQDRYIVRFPDGMRDRLKELAKDNNRSLNAQIVHMLEFAIDEMDISAKVYTDPDKANSIPAFLRDEIRRSKNILEHILNDYETGKIGPEAKADESDSRIARKNKP